MLSSALLYPVHIFLLSVKILGIHYIESSLYSDSTVVQKLISQISDYRIYWTTLQKKCCSGKDWLQKCEVTDKATVVVNHLINLSTDFKERFSDLKQIDIPSWIMQPTLALSVISNTQYN